MMPLLAGAGGLLLLYALLRAFATATPAQVKQGLVVSGAMLGAGVVAVLLLSGRSSLAMTGLVFFGPALWRWWQGYRAR